MEQSTSWEVNRFSAIQDIPRILWKPKVHHCIYKSQPPVSILSLMSPLHAPKLHFQKVQRNIILPSMLGSSKRFFPLCFHTKPCKPLSPPP